MDIHTQTSFLLRVSVTHRPALARLILGRWKERSLRMKPPSLPILQGIYPDRPKDSEIHFDTLALSAKIKIKKGENPFSQETLQKKKQNRQMYTQILSKNELVINAEEEKERKKKGEKEKKKKKQNKWTW